MADPFDTSGDDQPPSAGSARGRWRKRVAIPTALGLVLIFGGGTVWLFRTSIVTGFVDRALTQRGVRATYRIDSIGLGVQRLSNVVVGDPANPDLTARDVELRIAVDFAGPRVVAVRGRGVRVRGRWTGERVTLGELDKLLPAPSNEPFSLPALRIDLRDAAARITTPWGPVAIGAEARGDLQGATRGQVALLAPTLMRGDCRMTAVSGRLAVALTNGAPTLRGPLGIGDFTCANNAVAVHDVRLGLTLSANAQLDDRVGSANIRTDTARFSGLAARAISGRIAATHRAAQTLSAEWLIDGSDAATGLAGARAIHIEGRGMRTATGTLAANGVLTATGGQTTGAATRRLATLTTMSDATPFGPLARRLGRALSAAGHGVTLRGDYSLSGHPARGYGASFGDVSARSVSGARFALAGERAISWTQHDGLALATVATFGGGDLPQGSAHLNRANGGAPLSGDLIIAPYGAGRAAIALAPVRFVARRDGSANFSTGAALTGPLGDGMVDRLTLPFNGTVDSAGSVTISGECRPVSVASAAFAGLRLGPTRTSLCGAGGAGAPLFAYRNGTASGTAVLPDLALAGTLGASQFRARSGSARYDLATQRFALGDVALALGPDGETLRLAASTLSGALDARGAGGGARGIIGGGTARIGATPFDLSAINGDWHWDRDGLLLTHTIVVTDSAVPGRFQPMQAQAVRLSFDGSVVRADGRLHEIVTATPVADLSISHHLANGAGQADFTLVPIRFARSGLQPEALSALSLGVVANVDGTVTGEGRINWSPDGVTSGGTFRTTSTDLAAAFGPVQRLAGEITFNDLIALTTPPGQLVTLGSVNTGIEVIDGRVRYQLLPDRHVRIEGGEWPFSGGILRLQPALLSMGDAQERRLTFELQGLDAALFLQRYNFANISATGVFDGILPTIFDANGGRIEGGSLVVRDGGGTVAYVGALSNRDLGYFANMAFGALRSLRYSNLGIRLDGRLDGDMVTGVKFAGLTQGEGTTNNFLTRQLANLPFEFNIRISAPFRQLLYSARSFYDPVILIDQNLPALLRAEREAAAARGQANTITRRREPEPGVQPPDSENRP